MDNESTK